MDDVALRYLTEYVKANGYAPSVREMGVYLGISPTSVHARLRKLEADGLIERVGPRAIRIHDG